MTETRFRHIEIEITSICDMRCNHCDRFIEVAPGGMMSLGQIELFLRETRDLAWDWRRIHVLGGEPTLHPDFREIVTLLLQYRNESPGRKLTVISNGYGRLNHHRQWLAEVGVQVNCETKSPQCTPAYFHNMHRAPIDLGGEASQTPCALYGTAGCGIGLTSNGYFLCGAGASVARVAGLDIGFLRLADVTNENCLKQAEALCGICGHKEGFQCLAVTNGEATPFWQEAIARFQTNPPRLSIYGADQ